MSVCPGAIWQAPQPTCVLNAAKVCQHGRRHPDPYVAYNTIIALHPRGILSTIGGNTCINPGKSLLAGWLYRRLWQSHEDKQERVSVSLDLRDD